MKVKVMFAFIFAIASVGSIVLSVVTFSSKLIDASMMPYVSSYFIVIAIITGTLTNMVVNDTMTKTSSEA